MLDLPPAVLHAAVRGAVVVAVPEVATTTRDGLAPVVRPGPARVVVPALLTVPGAHTPAWLEVNGVPGSPVDLVQGAPRRVATAFVARPGARVTVRLVSGRGVVAVWQHTVSR